MKYKVDDVIKATVTKSKPGQHVGLVLEERYHRIFVTDVSGLFKTNGVPVHADDQLLEVNGIGVHNKAVFPNGVDDINKFLKGEWNIWIKVKKGRDSEDNHNDTRDDTEPSVASYPSIKPLRQFYQHRQHQQHHASSDSEDSTIANSDEDNTQPEEQSPRRKPRSRSTSPFRALVTPENRRGIRKPKSLVKDDGGESVSENTDTTFSLSEDDNTQPHARCPNLLSIEEDDQDSASLSPLTPKEEEPKKQSSETTIKSIKGNEKAITVEMNNGQSVCVTPEQLLKVGSDHGIECENIGPPSVYTPKKKKSKGKLKDKSRSPRSTKKSHSSSTKEIRKKSKKAPRRRSTGYLRKDSNEEESLASISESQASNSQDLRKHLTKTPRRKSLGSLAREEDSDCEEPQPRLKMRGGRNSLMDESTHSCMTNLIDPGDLMKIKGFVSKPEMNGMTVEVVRKSKGSKGKRWDVRVITKKDVKAKSSFNPKRLISVATENLKHFL